MRIFTLLIGSILSCSAIAFDAAVWPRDQPFPSREGLTGQLDNGVRYAIEHKSYGDNEDKAYIMVLVQTGSLYESEDQAGYAHFIEHVLFRGSRGQSAEKTKKFFEKMGVAGSFHGQQGLTFLDRTVYSLPIPEDPDKNMPTAVKILATRVGDPLFRVQDVEAERDIVLAEELQGRLSEAGKRSRVEYLGKDHELIQHLPIGTRESLSEATRDDLHAFYREWYRPDRMIVVVVGDVVPAKIEKSVRKYFGKLRKPKSANPDIRRVGSPTGETTVFLIDPTLEVRTVGLTLFRDSEPSWEMSRMKDRLTENLGASMLRNRLSDYQNEKGYVTGLRARFSRQQMDFETDSISFRVEDDHELQAFSEVVDIVSAALVNGFTAQEITLAKQLVGKSFDRNEEQELRVSNSGIANQWLGSMRYGHEPTNSEVIAAAGRVLLAEITADEINAALKARFFPQRTALVMGVPEGEKFDASLEDFKEVLARLTDPAAQELVAAVDSETASLDEAFVLEGLTPGKVIQSSYHESIDAHHLVLSNNVHVLFKKDPQENSPVRIRMRGAGGLTLLDDYDVVSGSMIREVIMSSGLRGVKGTAISNFFRLHRTNVSVFFGQTEHGLTVRTTPEEMDFALRALHIMFTEARVDQDIFDTIITKSRTGITGSIASPRFQYMADLGDVLSPGRKLNSSNIHPDLLNGITPEWIQTSVDTLFAHAGGTYFTVSGPLDWQEIEPLILKYVGSLPTGEPRMAGKIDYTYAVKGAEIRRNANPDERSEGTLFFIEPAPGFDDRMAYVRSTYANLLNQRLFKEIREEQALVYSISARVASPKYPSSPHGQVVVSYVADPANIREIETRVIRIMNEMSDDVQGEKINTVQKMQNRNFKDALDRPGYMLGALYDSLIQNKAAPNPDDYLTYIDSVSEDDVKAYAKKVNDLVLIKAEYRPQLVLHKQ
jgi:zinc protease